MVNEIENFSCRPSCSDISDGEGQISTENLTQSEVTKTCEPLLETAMYAWDIEREQYLLKL